MYSVSSWFQVKLEDRSSEPIRQFLVGTSDYSDRVIKWPKIKRTSNSFRPVRPTINLDNADGNLNHFYETTIKMVQECYLKLGFAIPISTANLVGYWPLNETSGTNAPDESGNGNDGTLVNMEDADWVDGVVGKCLDFDGSGNEYVDIPSLTLGTAWTVSCWYNPDSFTKYAHLFTADAQNDFTFKLDIVTGEVCFYTSTSGGVWSGYNLTIGVWEYLVVTYDGTNVKIYINGDEKVSSAETLDIGATGYKIGLFRNVEFRAEASDGQEDEVRIYDKALTASEVKALYDNPGQERVMAQPMRRIFTFDNVRRVFKKDIQRREFLKDTERRGFFTK